ncbi:MAG: hypothetical protein A2293_05480 [Elusimicrobia bacterium RIFOXYB2_FULL_49_7]|nr:MAG: hypothetical protein A2293_05480 [Elusimicrobia bacterium RIFOXYB2_FULL_49_7]
MDSNKLRILVVDDDTEVLEFLKAFFEKFHYETIVASTPKEGMRQLVVNPPDLVLLDIMMPEKDGLTMLKEIKELDKEVSVAMITAYKDAERVIEAFRLGAMDCLLKPFNLDYITNSVLPRVRVRPK